MSNVELASLDSAIKLAEKAQTYTVISLTCVAAFVITMLAANLALPKALAHDVILVSGFLFGLPLVFFLQRSLLLMEKTALEVMIFCTSERLK